MVSSESSDIENRIRSETLKWLDKIKNTKIEEIEENRIAKEIKENIKAYIKDTEYFLGRNMLIEAFESIVWAWAWLEIGARLNILKMVK